MMYVRKFINRENELSVLEKYLRRDGFKLLPIYGRRRIGKTALIKRFLEGQKGIYFLCGSSGTRKNIGQLSMEISQSCGFPRLHAESFRELFRGLVESGFRDGVIALDEFPYLIRKDPSLLSEFQYITDEILADTNLMLILCGSSIGLMENFVLGERSPLFGRRVGQLNVKPIDHEHISGFLPDLDIKDRMIVDSIVGGVPRYLHEFQEHDSIDDTLKWSFFSSDGYLYREAFLILRDELREPDTYMNILEAIAAGNTRMTRIADASYLQAKDMPKYLRVLMQLDIIQRIHPVTEIRPNTKKSIYRIKDNYFRFWFRFVHPDRTHIEFQRPDVPLDRFKAERNDYLGQYLEDHVANILRSHYSFPRVGRWWYKGDEIDVVGIDERKKRVVFCEVKWRNRRIGPKVIEDLISRSDLVRGVEDLDRYHMVVSMGGFTDGAMRIMEDEKIVHLTLKEIEEIHDGKYNDQILTKV